MPVEDQTGRFVERPWKEEPLTIRRDCIRMMVPELQRRREQLLRFGIDRLLGAAVAHELGHLLLPPGSHGSGGLMQSSWDREQFTAVRTGALHFSPRSAAHIRSGVDTILASSDPERSATRKR